MSGVGSTYRIQVESAGGLGGVASLLPYLRALGVSTVYLSPIFRARSGSEHGYDVVDPTAVDPELGGDEALERLLRACRDEEMGLLLDIVPNHMATSHENPWWRSVLRHGPDSPRASFFDVDWDEPPEPVKGKLVLPILGRRYPRVLASGELTVERGDDGFVVRYWDRALPVDPRTEPLVLEADPGGEGDVDRALEHLGRADAEPSARRALDRLLSHQRYWLVHWRIAPEEVNYRRFFHITDLAALRMEREEVFVAWHARLRELLADPVVRGVRVDHVDGLRHPGRYLERLRRLARDTRSGAAPDPPALYVEKILAPGETLPEEWRVAGTTGYDFLATADGVLLHPDGVATLEARYRTFTDAPRSFREEAVRGKRRMARAHFRRDLSKLVERALPLVRSDPRGRDLASSEVEEALLEITAHLRVYRSYLRAGEPPMSEERAPIREAVDRARKRRRRVPASAYGVLESLLTLDAEGIGGGEGDGAEGLDRSAELEVGEGVDAGEGVDGGELVERWQQLTGAVMAKGVEDTAFYVHNALISRNEVGADPDEPPAPPEEFHAAVRRRAAANPAPMNATSTHDTKRSEDVRARLHVLSELAGEWGRRVERWREWNRPLRSRIRGRSVPTPNEEWLLYQTLVGAWPLDDDALPGFRERLEGFLRKAAREAKEHTDWTRPREDHEEALVGFARAVLEPDRDAPFLDDFLELQRKVAFYGAVNSLTLALLKLASPGVPDLYQGTELWDFSLVDPDNRRPVDYQRRKARLEALERRFGRGRDDPETRPRRDDWSDLLEGWRDGGPKLLLVQRALALRNERPELLLEGEHRGLEVTGPRSGHVVAFERRRGEARVLAVAPRLPTGLAPAGEFPLGEEVWKETTVALPGDAPQRWRDRITGAEVETLDGDEGTDAPRRLELSAVLDRFPVALLEGR